jgi:ribosome-binding ATPase
VTARPGSDAVATVKVPDPRLQRLRDLYCPKKYVPAEVTFVDPALSARKETRISAARESLSEADAFVLVVQAFGGVDGQGKPLDSLEQMKSVLLEWILADLELVETRLERIEKDRGRRAVNPAEVALLERCRERLEGERSLAALEFREDERAIVRALQFVSVKPVVVVINCTEEAASSAEGGQLQEAARGLGAVSLQFCAPLETEIAGLDEAERGAFLQDFGIEEPARDRLIRAAYETLGLISFFTVGEDEVRAWTLRRGATAREAGGAIHTDIARGFIRAEVVRWDALLERGSLAACRESADLRLEGKEYPVCDGDVIHFRFNV